MAVIGRGAVMAFHGELFGRIEQLPLQYLVEARATMRQIRIRTMAGRENGFSCRTNRPTTQPHTLHHPIPSDSPQAIGLFFISTAHL